MLKLQMTRKLTVILILFFSGMHAMYAADQQVTVLPTKEELFVAHEQLKKDFNLSAYMALPDDLQLVVLEYLQPDAQYFKENLENYHTLCGITNMTTIGLIDLFNALPDRLQGALVGEFFYNYVQQYNERLKKSDTNFSIKKIPSQLCTIKTDHSRLSILEVAANSYNERIKYSDDNRDTRNFFAIRLIELGIFDKQTEFHHATKNNNQVLVKILLQHASVDINAQDADNKRPLDYAISHDNILLIQLLLEHDAIAPVNEGLLDLLCRHYIDHRCRSYQNGDRSHYRFRLIEDDPDYPINPVIKQLAQQAQDQQGCFPPGEPYYSPEELNRNNLNRRCSIS